MANEIPEPLGRCDPCGAPLFDSDFESGSARVDNDGCMACLSAFADPCDPDLPCHRQRLGDPEDFVREVERAMRAHHKSEMEAAELELKYLFSGNPGWTFPESDLS